MFTFGEVAWMFLIYAIIGWLWETPLVSIRNKKFVNRGFLRGPIIPIYGFAATTIMVSLDLCNDWLKVEGWGRIVFIFIFAAIVASVWEYVTSAALEALFKTRWWDYSKLKFNLKGRIALSTSVFWGVGSTILWQFVNRGIITYYHSVPGEVMTWGLSLIYFAISVDTVFTLQELISLRSLVIKLQKTAENDPLNKRFIELLERKKLNGRLFKKYPNAKLKHLPPPTLLSLMKMRMILILILSLTMIVCLMGINFFGMHLNVLFVCTFLAIILQFAYIFRQIILPLEQVYVELKAVGIRKRTIEIEASLNNRHVYPIIQEINFKLQKLDWLISMIQNISNNESFNDVLHYMFTSFSIFIPLNHIGIGLIGEDGTSAHFAYSLSDETMLGLSEKLLANKDAIDPISLYEFINSEKPRVINTLEAHLKQGEACPFDKILYSYGVRSSITIPLKINNNALGFVLFSSNSEHVYEEEHAHFLEVLADSIAISFNKNIFINEILYSNSLALAKLAESRDHFTGEHLLRIKSYSRLIAQFLSTDSPYKGQIDYQFIKDIEKYSALHDIGKVAIEDSILLKPGKLTEAEFEIMKKHTLYGGRVLREADASIQKGQTQIFRMGIDIAECHHEKWCGGGYPYGLKGDLIPLSARIVAAADVLDALTSERPYKKAMPFEAAFNLLVDGRGVAFDPEIIDVMIKYKHEFHQTYEGFMMTSFCNFTS